MIVVKTREEFLKECEKLLKNIHPPYRPICAELGVLNGEFSKKIMDIIDPVFLALVDPFEISDDRYFDTLDSLPISYSNKENLRNVYRMFHGDRRVYMWIDYSYNIAKIVADNFDFIYHDASHKYEDIKRDLNDWVHKLVPEGIMCGHDYIEHPDFGVIQAVNEFCAEHNFEMIIFNENGGDYALKRK